MSGTSQPPVDQPVAAPEAAAPAVAPEVAAAAPAAEPVVAPVAGAPAAEAPVAEAPAAEAPKLPTDTPTLLEQETPPAEVKPEEKPVEAPGEKPADKPAETPAEKPPEDKPAEPLAEDKPPEQAAELPAIEWKYELPSSITMNDEQRGSFNEALSLVRTDPNAAAGKMLDMAVNMMTEYSENLRINQFQEFANTRAEWANEVKADPILGGAGHRTAMAAIARARDAFVSDHPKGTPEHTADLQAFNQFLHYTGAGDHPGFLRMMHRVSQFISEPSVPKVVEVKPAPPPTPKGNPLHDNPRSSQLNGRTR